MSAKFKRGDSVYHKTGNQQMIVINPESKVYSGSPSNEIEALTVECQWVDSSNATKAAYFYEEELELTRDRSLV